MNNKAVLLIDFHIDFAASDSFKTSFARNKQHFQWNTLWVKELSEKSRGFIWHMEQASCGRVDIFWGDVECIVSRPHSHAAHKLYLADTTCLAGRRRSRSRGRNRRRGSCSVLLPLRAYLSLAVACCMLHVVAFAGHRGNYSALCTLHFALCTVCAARRQSFMPLLSGNA